MAVFCGLVLFFMAPVLLFKGDNTSLENFILVYLIFFGIVLFIKVGSCFTKTNKDFTTKQIQKDTEELNKYTEEFGLIEWDEK